MDDEALLIAVEEARDQVHAAMEALQTLLNVLNDKILALNKKQRYLEELKVKRQQRHDEIASSIIKANMRGTIFEIENDALTRVDGSYFDVMLSIGNTMINECEGCVPVYFIDRSYEGFERIISNMSGNELCLEGMSKYDIQIVYDNMGYFILLDYTSNIDIKLSSGVYSMIELGDGRLCTGHTDGNIALISTESNIESMMVLSGHTSCIICLALLPDGRLCSGSGEGTIKIWNTSSCQCDMSLINHTNGVTSICILSDTRICSVSQDKTIKYGMYSLEYVR